MTCTLRGCGFDHFHTTKDTMSNLTAGELRAWHIGRTLTIQIGDDAALTDKLTAVYHHAEIIEDTRLTGETHHDIGRIHTTATFLRCGEITLTPNQKVTVQ